MLDPAPKSDKSDLAIIANLSRLLLDDAERSLRRESPGACADARKRDGAIALLACDVECITNRATDRRLR